MGNQNEAMIATQMLYPTVRFFLKELSLFDVLFTNKLIKIAGKKASNVSGDLLRSDRTSTIQQLLVRIVERICNLPARVFPFVDQLLEHARVRVLRDEGLAQQLEPLARHLRHDRGIVQKPPTTKRHQVAELPRRHAQPVLVLARKKRHEEFHVRMLQTKSFDRSHVRPSKRIAGVAQLRIQSTTHADH